jgi:hypothetical protein
MPYVRIAFLLAVAPLVVALLSVWWLVASIVNRIDPLEDEWLQHEIPNSEAPVVSRVAYCLNPDRGRSGRVSWRRG